MEKAIENLNKTVQERDKMIYAILSSKYLSYREYDSMEKRLQNRSFQSLIKQFNKLKQEA